MTELQEIAQIGYKAAQRGDKVEGSLAMDQIRSSLRSRFAAPEL